MRGGGVPQGGGNENYVSKGDMTSKGV